jgi:LysM repeat protein
MSGYELHLKNRKWRGKTRLLLGALVLLALPLPAAEAQSLRGSKPSIEKMYVFAVRQGLPFYRTPESIMTAAALGRLVPLAGNSDYELSGGVGWPWVTPETRRFVEAFARQYVLACDSPLVVTSATRPTSRQPRNASEKSVHPTGIAVDFRRPPAGPCADWMRQSLLALEQGGMIEATEERFPVHFHVAVLVQPGRNRGLPQLASGERRAPVSRVVVASGGDVAPEGGVSYTVRQGDSLWDIARRHRVSVADIVGANSGLRANGPLKPGAVIAIPASGTSRN